MKASEVKKGNVVEHNGTVYQVRDIERSSPQGRGGNVKFRFTLYSVPGGIKYDLSVGGDEEQGAVDSFGDDGFEQSTVDTQDFTTDSFDVEAGEGAGDFADSDATGGERFDTDGGEGFEAEFEV